MPCRILLFTVVALCVHVARADEIDEQAVTLNPGLKSLSWMVGDWHPTNEMKPSASGGDGWVDQGFYGVSVRISSDGNQLLVSYKVLTGALSCYADVLEIIEICSNGDLTITCVSYEDQGPISPWTPSKIKTHPTPVNTARAERTWKDYEVKRYKVKKREIPNWSFPSDSGKQMHRRMDPKYFPKIKNSANPKPYFIGCREEATSAAEERVLRHNR